MFKAPPRDGVEVRWVIVLGIVFAGWRGDDMEDCWRKSGGVKMWRREVHVEVSVEREREVVRVRRADVLR